MGGACGWELTHHLNSCLYPKEDRRAEDAKGIDAVWNKKVIGTAFYKLSVYFIHNVTHPKSVDAVRMDSVACVYEKRSWYEDTLVQRLQVHCHFASSVVSEDARPRIYAW